MRELGFADYDDYLASPHWRSVRAKYRNSTKLPQDCMCGATDTVLHHKTYERLGAEYLTDLVPLCFRCHAMVHVLEKRGDIGLDLSGLYSLDRALEYLPLIQARIGRADADRFKNGVESQRRIEAARDDVRLAVLRYMRVIKAERGMAESNGLIRNAQAITRIVAAMGRTTRP